ncbi:MAG: glycosyltransferase [Gemmatimonadaceae bacterium]|nr:glycosyltransferase [Gemmatimonadaceae bacterium]
MTSAGAGRKRFILVGPRVDASAEHPGGQLTAARSIVEFACRYGHEMEVIDTRLNFFSPPSIARRVRLGIGRFYLLGRRLAASRHDGVILFVGAGYSFYERALLAALARCRGVKTLFCIRDGAFPGWAQSSLRRRRIAGLLLRIPFRVVVQGHRLATLVEELGVPGERIAIVPNWLGENAPQEVRPRVLADGEPMRMVFVGWLVPEKGVRELREAFSRLRGRHDVTLDLVGGGTLEGELREAIADGALPGATVHGWLEPGEVRGMLQRAHLFVLPTYFEGFPNALLEAMACGLPSVCSDVGAIPDSIVDGYNGFLVPPKDVPALEKAIGRYLQEPGLLPLHSVGALDAARQNHDKFTNLKKLFSSFDTEAAATGVGDTL